MNITTAASATPAIANQGMSFRSDCFAGTGVDGKLVGPGRESVLERWPGVLLTGIPDTGATCEAPTASSQAFIIRMTSGHRSPGFLARAFWMTAAAVDGKVALRL